MTLSGRLTIVIGVNQLLSWATSYYIPAVIAGAAAQGLGVSRVAILGGFSWALLVSGVCAPRIGRRIDRLGGRGVLAAGSVALALGMVLLAGSTSLALWYVGWTVMGLGMAMGLYEAAFSTTGRLLGAAAAPAITGVTLFAGFASSLGWPAGAYLIGHIGWRQTLLAYAALQLLVNLPLTCAIPAAPAVDATPKSAGTPGEITGNRLFLICLGGFFTIRWFLSSAMSVFALPLLRGTGLVEHQAVAVAALIGPGQILGRLLEFLAGRHVGALGRARIGAALMPLGLLLLLLDGPIAAGAFALCYGISNGILTINRGSLPLALFGPSGYAALLGRLAMPVLLAQAAAPSLIAPLVAALPARPVLMLVAAAGAGAMLALWPLRLPPSARTDEPVSRQHRLPSRR